MRNLCCWMFTFLVLVIVAKKILSEPGLIKCVRAPMLLHGPCRTPILVINMQHRHDKLTTMQARIGAFGKSFTRSPGVDLRREPHLLPSCPYVVGRGSHLGIAGLALAHLRAWETVARDYDVPVLILEDDANPLSLVVCDQVYASAPEHDLFLLNVLRPRAMGNVIDEALCLYDVKPQKLKHYLIRARLPNGRLPNAWASSYMISPRGAHKMLELFRKHPLDIDRYELDLAWMRALIHHSHDISVAVIGQTNRYFIHDERDSDKRALGKQ